LAVLRLSTNSNLVDWTTGRSPGFSPIEPAFQALTGRPDALYVGADPLAIVNRVRINTLALGARLPTMSSVRAYVEAGALAPPPRIAARKPVGSDSAARFEPQARGFECVARAGKRELVPCRTTVTRVPTHAATPGSKWKRHRHRGSTPILFGLSLHCWRLLADA
jgi:hypothetical protein